MNVVSLLRKNLFSPSLALFLSGDKFVSQFVCLTCDFLPAIENEETTKSTFDSDCKYILTIYVRYVPEPVCI